MSNFPPGVTGTEPRIAGSPEGRRRVECSNMVDATKIRIVRVGDPRESVFPFECQDDRWNDADRKREFELRGYDEIECPFVGEVDGTYDGEDFVAECPLCDGEILVSYEEDRCARPRNSRIHGRVQASGPDYVTGIARKAYCGVVWKDGVPTPGHGERDSDPALAFFESRGEGSSWTRQCAVEGCGRYETVHQSINPSTGRPGITDHAFVPRPDPGFDSYYCGCRGWD